MRGPALTLSSAAGRGRPEEATRQDGRRSDRPHARPRDPRPSWGTPDSALGVRRPRCWAGDLRHRRRGRALRHRDREQPCGPNVPRPVRRGVHRRIGVWTEAGGAFEAIHRSPTIRTSSRGTSSRPSTGEIGCGRERGCLLSPESTERAPTGARFMFKAVEPTLGFEPRTCCLRNARTEA